MKKWEVIYTDFGDSCDGRARKLGTFKTYEAAREEMLADVDLYIESEKENGKNREIVEDTGDFVLVGNQEHGCQWQIMEQ